MNNTHVRPSRDLRNHYAELSRLTKEHDHVIITNNGKGDTVLINFDDYASYEEFLHFKYIKRILAEAKEGMNKPNAVFLSEKEFWQEIEKA